MKESLDAPVRPVAIGVLGTARIATGRVIPAMREAVGCEVVAIASRRPERARAVAAAFDIPRAHGGYESLLSDPSVEAVYLPLPNHEHVRWTVRALEAGKHVLCEKPLAVHPEDLAPLFAAAARTGLVVEEAFMVREHPQWSMARDLLAGGRIGSPRFVEATYCHTVDSPGDIRFSASAGGGALLDVGCYVVATMRFLLGREPRRAFAQMDMSGPDGVDLTTHGRLDFGGASGSFIVSIAAARRQRLEVIGTEGWMRLTVPFAHPPHLASTIELGASRAPGTEVTESHAFAPVNQYTLQAERFARRVRGLPATAWPLEDALANLQVLDALVRSNAQSRWCEVAGDR